MKCNAAYGLFTKSSIKIEQEGALVNNSKHYAKHIVEISLTLIVLQLYMSILINGDCLFNSLFHFGFSLKRYERFRK